MRCLPTCIALLVQLFLSFSLMIDSLWAQPPVSGRTNAAVLVNKSAITYRDIDYKLSIERAYENQQISKEGACVLLVNDAIEREVAIMNGVVSTQQEINAFKAHVKQGTRAPQILKRVQDAFGGDILSYDRIYLSPRIVNQKLHDYYNRNQKIHQSEFLLIRKAFKHVLNGGSLSDAAETPGLHFASFKLDNQAEISSLSIQSHVHEYKMIQQTSLIAVLKELSVGEVAGRVIEDNFSYRIVRLIGKKEDSYLVDSVYVNKKSFDQWYKGQAAKIIIVFQDSCLFRSITEIYPNIWWKKLVSSMRE